MTIHNQTRRQPAGLRLRKLPSVTAAVFALAMLLVFNLSTFALLRRFERSKETDLAERLAVAARSIARDIEREGAPLALRIAAGMPADDAQRLLAELADTISHAELNDRLAEQAGFFQLRQVVLMTTGATVLVDTRGRSFPGDPYPFAELDTDATARVAAGGMAESAMYYLDDQPYKRVYAPVRAGEGQVAGIVQVSVSPPYMEAIRDMRRRVAFQGLIGSALLLLIGYFLYAVFRYAVRAEGSAMKSQRIEAMGALAGGLAHEMRNPLAIIRALAEEAGSSPSVNSRTTENTREIVAEVERLNELVTRFLSLSRPPEAADLRPVDLAAELRQVAGLMRRSAPQTCDISEDYPEGPVSVRAEEPALRQLFLNLLLNATEALPPGGGQVHITLRQRRQGAEITIADSGRGIARKDLARLFEPFYTTKPSGTGLGLAISRGIVESLGGTIAIDSEQGRGTIVTVAIPTGEESV